jgi:hypothetical protein
MTVVNDRLGIRFRFASIEKYSDYHMETISINLDLFIKQKETAQ